MLGLTSGNGWGWLSGSRSSALLIFVAYRLAHRIAAAAEARYAKVGCAANSGDRDIRRKRVIACGTALFRISGDVRVVLEYAQTGAVYLAAAWLCMVVAIMIGEVIVSSEHLQTTAWTANSSSWAHDLSVWSERSPT